MKRRKRLMAIVMSLLMIVTMMPGMVFATGVSAEPVAETATGFVDMPSDWSTEALTNAVANGLLKGYTGEDGTFIRPSGTLTRAEMATVVNRAFGAVEKASLSKVSDVPATEWFAPEMAKAAAMGTMNIDTLMRPTANITRQEACTVLARAFKLEGTDTTALNSFADKASVASFAAKSMSALVEAGYIAGSNGMLNPTANITRAEFAKIMDNMIKQYITVAGTVSEVVASGNIMVNAPGTVLDGVTIKGSLIIGDGVGEGEVTLNNVKVTGETIIRGGGTNSIIIKGNSELGKVIIAKPEGNVRVSVEGKADVELVSVADGEENVIIEGKVTTLEVNSDAPILVQNAQIKNINVPVAGADLNIAATATVTNIKVEEKAEIVVEGKVTNIDVAANAGGTELNISKTATVSNLETDAKIESTGEGSAKNVTGSGSVTQNGETTPATPSTGGSSGGSGGGSKPSTPPATVDDVTINGTKGVTMGSQTVEVELLKDTFVADITEVDEGWITNLPVGLSAVAERVSDTEARITISGYPTESSEAQLSITIPAEALTGNASITVKANTNAKFNINVETWTVTITAGQHMAKTAESGEEAQSVEKSDPMTAVVYTADTGYYFTDPYTVATVNGVSVTRNSYTQITVSGTPTDNATITLLDATAKGTPSAPVGVGSTNCTNASNNDGTITNVTTAMEYRLETASTWTGCEDTTVTGLIPGTYQVRYEETVTQFASSYATVTIAGAPETWAVTITAGDNMTKASGEATQSVVKGQAITNIVYTANTGYYFPEDYSVPAAVLGVNVVRDGYTQITVSGTPTADNTFTLIEPTAKAAQDKPDTVGKTDCTTEANNNGTLEGITAEMEYRLSTAPSWTPGTGSTVTGRIPGTYEVRYAETATKNASLSTELVIAAFTPAPYATVANVTISGEPDEPMTTQTVVVTLHNATFAAGEFTEKTNWVVLPMGLTATAERTDNTTATITITGTPNSSKTDNIIVTIPASALEGIENSLTAQNNDDAVFAIVTPPAPAPTATVADVTISGTTEATIASQYLDILLTNDTFKGPEDSVWSSNHAGWVTNAPSGLSSAASRISDTQLTITFSGSAAIESTDPIEITIPAEALTGGQAVTVTVNPNAVFNITVPTP